MNMPAKMKAACAAFWLVASATGPLAAQESDFSKMLSKADSYRLLTDRGFSFTYTLTDADETSVMRVYLRDGDRSNVLSVYLSPPKLSGRRILVQGNAFWMLDKNMRDPIRISSRQMLFGQAAAGDITRLSFSDGYDVASCKTADGKSIMDLTAKEGAEVSYPKIILVVTTPDCRPVSAELYAASGVLMKTIRYESYGEFDGKTLLAGFKIVNALNRDESAVGLSDYSRDTLAGRFFSREGMKAIR
ncbi:MAG: outer membrane lipoprotein-sorting protein [Spirochaetales bacterium]|nr:outer membrane lipoprotein-sorting protein [Spirochaetales bacterium]